MTKIQVQLESSASAFEAQPHETTMPLVPMAVLYSSSNNASHQDVLSSLLQRMQALQTQVDTNALMLGRPRLCNVAAQVLLYALGDKPRTANQQIVHQADAVITRRNNEHDEHFSNLAALEHEVGVCVQLMDANPMMRQACRWECWVLDNWDAFKAARPIVD